jgi:lysophospholipid acyltransferase (LPLAT)-like uncharacterized protein
MAHWIERTAFEWGRIISAYGNYVVKTGHIKWEGLENIPGEATVWYAWHSTNLLAVALHHTISPRPTQALIPPGLVGITMNGWLAGAGFTSLQLPKDGTGNPSAALKATIRGLSKNHDVIVAVDGPYGPAGRVRPGTFWLGKMTGRPLVAVGLAARAAFRVPRWDRHLVPLPGARIVGVVGKPRRVERDQEIDQPFLDAIKLHLNNLSHRARELLEQDRTQSKEARV